MQGKGPVVATLLAAVALGAAVDVSGSGAAEMAPIVKERRETMKGIGKRMGAIKAFAVESQGSRETAATAAREIAATAARIPDLFPAGTSLEDGVGETGARPIIWAELDTFKARARNMGQEAQALVAVFDGDGDAAALQEQFAKLGKQGCGGCHETFRKKLED